MVDISGLSQTPSANTSVGGINIAENCPAANVNDAQRWLAAAIATIRDAIPNAATFMSKAGGIFTGNPTYSGQGGYLHNASSAALGGTVTPLPQGSPLPASPSDGDIVIFYT